jgi:malonyl-CoA decarboxylase
MDTSVFRDTLDNLLKAWQGIAGGTRDNERPPAVAPHLPEDDAKRVRKLIRTCLEARGGEVSSRRRAAALGQMYLTLDDEGRRRFLELLARDFAVDRKEVRQAALELRGADGEEECLAAEEKLREILISPRLRLLKQFNALPQGIKFLVDLRADLLRHIGGDPVLKSLDTELQNLLATWFDVGFLELRHITWDSPAALLEKLIAYEAVHEIHSWQDLRNRLESDRRCYAFFHPGMPDEPLIFVEVALVSGISDSIQTLLDESIPEMNPLRADTAIFYSISNTQKGLLGISFGHFLIKRVADDLSHEFPNIQTFATLSPIPGFGTWLAGVLGGESQDELTEGMRAAIKACADRLQTPPLFEEILTVNEWWRDEEAAALLREPLERLCARYFHAVRGDGAPLDPVERFHLGNGARIERLNWLGDTSEKGMRQSCGLMVNYLYRLEDIEKNHERYATERRIASAAPIKELLKEPPRDNGRKGRFPKIFSAD